MSDRQQRIADLYAMVERCEEEADALHLQMAAFFLANAKRVISEEGIQ